MRQDETATLHIAGHPPISLAILSPTLGNIKLLDIQNLFRQGYITYDPGFSSTAACQSQISFIDGDQGILLYRGYPIEQLAQQSSYLEVCYLLLYGEQPQQNQFTDFKREITYHSLVHEQIMHLFCGFKRNAHPMAILCGVVGALAAFYHNTLDVHNAEHRKIIACRLLSKVSTLAAMSYKYIIGQPFIYPNNTFSFAGNLLSMLFALPSEPYQLNPVLEHALDKILILHADHEQNASTTTVRIAGSSGANPFACIAAGIACLWGPAHGGANEACLNMLTEIGKPENIPQFIARAKDENDSFRLMGFGHRIYKNYDPRAKIMRDICHQVLNTLSLSDPLFETAQCLEAYALQDDYFISRKLYPNVDFYSGIILKAMQIPPKMFTVLFAVARTVGWIAHWKEMYEPHNEKNSCKLARPRQYYTGPKIR